MNRLEKIVYSSILISCLLLAGFSAGSTLDHAVIRENSVQAVHINGEWAVQYSYSVNGEPCVEFLRDEHELADYRAYLEKFGRFVK